MKNLTLPALCLVAGYLLSYPPVDDAYITFRYAENIARGHGVVYNQGELILGVTTPLWALLLGMGASIGIPPPVLAGLLPPFIAALCFWFLGWIFLQRYSETAAIFLPAAALLYFPIMVAIFSGMETALYIGASCGAITAATRRKPYVAGILSAAACLLRPDGILALIVICVIFRRDLRSSALKAVGSTMLLIAPWIVYATAKYGSALPQSVYAKQVLYPAHPGKILLMCFEALTQTPLDLIVIVGGLAGLLFFARRDTAVRYFVLWAALYLAGIAASGVKPIFYWYLTPLIAIAAVPGWGGLTLLYKERFPHHFSERRLRTAVLALYLVLLGDSIYRAWQPDAGQAREQAYRQILVDYADKIPKSARILLGETGILGYGLIDNYIIDSAGLNSEQPFKIITAARTELIEKGHRFGDINRESSWAIKLVQTSNPDWIIAPRGRMQLAIMEEQDWFQSRYARLALYAPEQALGIGVYRRR